MSRQPAVYYHYTSHEALAGILDAKMILPSLPHPATPGILTGESIVSSVGAVFLTRMDPSNSKESIAFNNYRYVYTETTVLMMFPSGGWANNLAKVEAYLALEIPPGPHLVEESVREGCS